jgi:YD repeat-containing protein
VFVTYDAVGRVTSRDGLGWRSAGAEYVYDSESGRKVSESLALDFGDVVSASSWAYDDGGRLAAATRDGVTTRYDFDVLGNITNVTRGVGRPTSFAYDEGNRLASRSEGDSIETVYTFDAERGLRIAQGPPGDVDRVRYSFDDAGRLISHAVDADADGIDEM